MAIERALHDEAIDSIAGVEGIRMDATALVEDVFLLSLAFDGGDGFARACESTCQALRDIVGNRIDTSALKYELLGWGSYHYRLRRAQGSKADCRMVYRRVEDGIEIKGFGHRRIPADFYERMVRTR